MGDTHCSHGREFACGICDLLKADRDIVRLRDECAALRQERNEARAEVAAQAADLMNATTRERQYEERITQLEADNAKLRAEVAAHLYQLKLARTEWANILDEDAALRARLALSEAVCEAGPLGWKDDNVALIRAYNAWAAWREGNK